MGIVLPHIFWAPSSRSSCFSLPRSRLCAPRLTPPSPTPQATTFPTPSARPLPTPPTLLPPSSTPPPPDARTTPGLWCPALMVVSLELSLLPLLPLLSPLLRRRGRRGRPPLRLRPILRLRLRPGCSTGPTATGPSATVTLPTATLPTPTLTTEASPEADPWLLYGGYGLPYGGYYGYGYHHAPYAYLGGCRNYLGGLVPCAGR